MKSRILILSALVLCCLTIGAADKKGKGKGKKTTEVLVMETEIDTFSYAFGKANTMGLIGYLEQRMGVDTTYMADFLVGFDADTLTVADKREKARLAGVDIRKQLQNQIIPQLWHQINDSVDLLNHDLFIAGFRAALSGENDLMPITMDSTQAFVKEKTDQYQEQIKEGKYGPNRTAGEEFLAANAQRDSVHVLPSGLQYKILTEGTGPVPTEKQKVEVNYRGTLLDGTEFDSSYKRNKPATFTCNQVIKGWTEALTMMPVGSKWILYIPQELAYGDKQSGKIPPYSMLTFEVELVGIVQ